MNPAPPLAEPSNLPLDDFFAQVAAVNPFTDNRVNGPAPLAIDVENIHQAAFERLTTLAQEAYTLQRGIGAVLWGEAGIGKSHLLARLARWAEQDKHACFIYLHNLQANPANLPRSLLKLVISTLTEGRVSHFHDTPLYRLVRSAVKAALPPSPTASYTWPEAQRAYDALIDRLSMQSPTGAALVDRTVYDVLLRFFGSAYFARESHADTVAALAARWLTGDALDPAEAQQLGLPPGRSRQEPVALADNQQIKHVLVALTQLALYRGQPFLLCFDQVDNLDQEQAAALARFLEALIDSAANLFVVTAGIQASLLDWRRNKVLQDSAWDRLAQFEIGLQRITVAEGCHLVAVRLAHFLEPYRHLDAVGQRAQQDRLFPLGQAWVEEFLKDTIEIRPRDVINKAREGWRRQQEVVQQIGGPAWLAGWGKEGSMLPQPVAPAALPAEQIQDAIDRKVAEKMAEHTAQRLAKPQTLPPDADHLSGLVATLLEQCRQANPSYNVLQVERSAETRRGQRPVYDLLVRQRGPHAGEQVHAGLIFLATASAQTATAALRRLAKDMEAPERVLLILDERLPLPLANRGREYYDLLRQRGLSHFYHLELPFEQYAELDALQAVVGLARAGDLEIELPPGQTRRVSEKEVIDSHHRQGRYAESVLLRAVLSEERAESEPREQAESNVATR
jgi:hypothetical protein